MNTKVKRHGINYYFVGRPECPECGSNSVRFETSFGEDVDCDGYDAASANFICCCGCVFNKTAPTAKTDKKRIQD